MRKCSLPPELANLTDDQLAQVDAWLDRFTYAKVQHLFLDAYKTPIGIMKLARYNARRLKARALSTAAQNLTAADLVALKNGAPIPDARLNKEILLRRTLQMVPSVPNAYHLRELHQIATYEERRALEESRIQLERDIAELALRKAELREEELALEQFKAAASLSNTAGAVPAPSAQASPASEPPVPTHPSA